MAKKKEAEFLNPFGQGVNYEMLLDAMEGKTVKEYCKGHLTDEQVQWLENDMEHFKNNKNNK